MCGLFGFTTYRQEVIKDLQSLTKALAQQSAARGVDATGIAYAKGGNVCICKEAKSARIMEFKHPDDIGALIGHTRHSTQGDEKKNYNNHPFHGTTKNARFALAHNGVLWNDDTLRRELALPKTKIETDSFIAVQLIESRKTLNMESLRYMAEQVSGSFSFALLDDRRNVWLVKGDSPLHILHFPKEQIYVYASTEAILYKALVDTPLFDSLKKQEYAEVPITEGEILKISTDGKTERSVFAYSYYSGKSWWQYGPYSYGGTLYSNEREDYLSSLRTVAAMQGLQPSAVDELLREGFTPEDVEDYIYEYQYYG